MREGGLGWRTGSDSYFNLYVIVDDLETPVVFTPNLTQSVVYPSDRRTIQGHETYWDVSDDKRPS